MVGGPRSGTTLLATMLAAHPDLYCGPETFCLWRWSRLSPGRRALLLDAREWPERATDFVCSLALAGRPIHLMYGLERDDVRAWLGAGRPSVAALLESLTAQRAAQLGRARWAEKTPRHLEVVDLIACTWSEARLLRIVRDPRDAAISLTRVPFGSGSLVANLSTLARTYEASSGFFRSHPNALTLRYEDLVADPERELRRVCGFVGVGYEQAMIEERGRAAGVAAEHEWWKGDVTGPLDASRVGAWRRDMPAEVQRYAALATAGFLDEHGYDGARTASHRLALVPSADAIPARHEAVLLELAARDAALVRPVPRGLRELMQEPALAFFGVSGQLDPDPQAAPARRAATLVGLGLLLAWRRLTARPVAWVPRLSLLRRRRHDPGERVMAKLLRLLARRLEAEDLPDWLARGDASVARRRD